MNVKKNRSLALLTQEGLNISQTFTAPLILVFSVMFYGDLHLVPQYIFWGARKFIFVVRHIGVLRRFSHCAINMNEPDSSQQEMQSVR